MSTEDPSLAIVLPPEVVDVIVERLAERLGAPSPAVEPWVGVPAVAAHLDCRPQRIYDLVCRRDRSRIPHRKEGARLLFRLSQIDRWVQSGGAA